VDPPGVFQGYEGSRLVGTMGPEGLVAPGKSAGSFESEWPLDSGYDKRDDAVRRLTLWTPRGIYKMELKPPGVTLWRAMPAGERAVKGGWLKAGEEEWTALFSDSEVHLYDGDDPQPRLSLPLPEKHGRWGLTLRRFPAQHRWIMSSREDVMYWTTELRESFDVFDDAGKLVAHFAFTQPDPPMPADPQMVSFARNLLITKGLINAACDAPVNEVMSWLGQQASVYASDSQLSLRGNAWYAGTFAAVLTGSAAGMFFLARRYGARFWPVWTALTVVLGPVMLLLLMALRPLPRREKCTHCGQPRRVEAAVCRQCGTAPAPPECRGTEIFQASSGGAA
jgi:hypothetical protein